MFDLKFIRSVLYLQKSLLMLLSICLVLLAWTCFLCCAPVLYRWYGEDAYADFASYDRMGLMVGWQSHLQQSMRDIAKEVLAGDSDLSPLGSNTIVVPIELQCLLQRNTKRLKVTTPKLDSRRTPSTPQIAYWPAQLFPLPNTFQSKRMREFSSLLERQEIVQLDLLRSNPMSESYECMCPCSQEHLRPYNHPDSFALLNVNHGNKGAWSGVVVFTCPTPYPSQSAQDSHPSSLYTVAGLDGMSAGLRPSRHHCCHSAWLPSPSSWISRRASTKDIHRVLLVPDCMLLSAAWTYSNTAGTNHPDRIRSTHARRQFASAPTTLLNSECTKFRLSLMLVRFALPGVLEE